MAITIRDVAKLAGTSVSAVSVALNGKVDSTIRISPSTRQRIFAAAQELGYVSNPIARSLATGRTKVIGLMLPYADAFVDNNPFCSLVMTGIMSEVVQRHYNLMLYTATSGIPLYQASVLIDARVEGLVLVMPPENSSVFDKCQRRGIHYVSVLREPIDDEWTVNADEYAGGCLAAEHFVRLGHRKIAHLVGNREVTTTAPRLQGFRDTLADAGIELPERYVVEAGFDWHDGQAAMQKLLDTCKGDMPTAVFAANDLCAEGAMRAVKEAGMSIPSDIAMIGYDDTWFSSMTQPSLTTIHMPIAEMGAIAAQMLIQRLEGETPENINPVLPVSLTIRESCGAARPNKGTASSETPIQ